MLLQTEILKIFSRRRDRLGEVPEVGYLISFSFISFLLFLLFDIIIGMILSIILSYMSSSFHKLFRIYKVLIFNGNFLSLSILMFINFDH